MDGDGDGGVDGADGVGGGHVQTFYSAPSAHKGAKDQLADYEGGDQGVEETGTLYTNGVEETDNNAYQLEGMQDTNA